LAIKIAPSIAAADLSRLGDAVKEAEKAGADIIHLDIADGHFAPNITFGPGTVKALRNLTSLPFDTHLMITDPLRYADLFVEAGSNIITSHCEVLEIEKFKVLKEKLESKKVRIGIAVKPETELPKWVLENIESIDVLLLMTVNPGFSGQKLLTSVLPKISSISSHLRSKNLNVEIEVDGGVEPENVPELVGRGATILVAGASAFRKGNVEQAIKELRERAESALMLR
jgi:ribulose-phosphate 3-epimerase